MNNNLPNPFNLNKEELAECKKMTALMSTHVVGRAYAKGQTATLWVLSMLMEMSLDDGVAKSKGDLLLVNSRLFDEMKKYIQTIKTED